MSERCCDTRCLITPAFVRHVLRAAKQTDTLTEAVAAVSKRYADKPVLGATTSVNSTAFVNHAVIAMDIECAMQAVGTDPEMIAKRVCPWGEEES